MRKSEVLKNIFGFDSFLGLQEEVIDHVIAGNCALVLMPTGGGKSLCYQVPALCRDGVGLVISPLIALMRDQVESLNQLGVRASVLNSTLTHRETKATEQKLLEGSLDLVYVSPEKLLTQDFLDHLGKCKLSVIAIDEAHCVSQWGHDFRPQYLKLNLLKKLFPETPRLALTATADAPTRHDIIEHLELKELFVSSFDRPNIKYAIVSKVDSKNKLIKFIEDNHSGDSGIVYCMSRNKVEATAKWLVEEGFNALPYHAGMDKNQREINQDKFYKEEGVIVVATIAFGMGIDKPDVRFVAHLDLPKSLESYYQETGRAGRDGLKSNAWLAYGLEDVSKIIGFIVSSNASEDQKRIERQKLDTLLGFCETIQCRRQVLLKYFGEGLENPCGNCDTCLEPVKSFDATVATQKALSCVYKTGERFGAAYIIDVLLGGNSARIIQFGHDKISTYGIGKEYSKNQWQSVFRQLVAKNLLVVDMEGHGGYSLGKSSKAVLRGEEKVLLREEQFSKTAGRSRGKKPGQIKAKVTLDNEKDESLFQELRTHRREVASEQKVPPFIIFHDRTLLEMVQKRPTSMAEFGRLPGVGKAKLERYAAGFLKVISVLQKTEGQRTLSSEVN
ncbi:MAG: DNA helicase RecQ [Nitrospinae bacterium]|nr:DNA helicase RecQ [Nitrospinota bacterium]MBL7019172.1 DNA helicase RecQ [Nitrospinaceae bacterium]